MAGIASGFGRTLRRDAWWLEALPVVIGLSAFGIYATLRAFEGAHYEWGPYLSPFYSPLIDAQHHWWPLSPALLILIFPLGFRVTCYYYRKAYYRAFFLDPPACAVSERSHRNYRGEASFPFILQNVHRYFLYAGVVFLCFLWYDAIRSFWWNGHFGIGVGSLVLLVNIVLLSLYLFSCHSLRHLIGGKLDCFSCTAAAKRRHGAWSWVSSLNVRHQLFAWCSLFSVGFADFYVRMVSTGAFKDLRIL
ncbi:MAG TPA: succinate dehydrogenase [Terriglobales bacterium]|nr:succinate dehydrogenase [Terriglobales bacterium]